MLTQVVRQLRLELRKSEEQTDGLRKALVALNGGKANGKRHLSTEARQRIANAQRMRWAKVRKAQKKAA